MTPDEQPDEDDRDWEEARRTPLDAYSWVIFCLLAAIVACLVLLTYAIITLRADDDRGAARPRAVVAASPATVPAPRAPGTGLGLAAGSPDRLGNAVLETEAGPALSLTPRASVRPEPARRLGG